jgi:AraC family transcriptional activator FtrA
MHPGLVAAVAYDGLGLFEFGGAAELFGLPRPELEVPWYDFIVVGIESRGFRSLGGVNIKRPKAYPS